VGARPSSTELHVFEVDYRLPKFCRFLRVGDPRRAPQPTGWVQFALPVAPSRVAAWLAGAFVNTEAPREERGEVRAYYTSTGEDAGGPRPLWVEARAGGTGTVVKVSCSEMAPAAEAVQDLCQCCDVKELESVAEFPAEAAELGRVLERVASHNQIRMRLTADMADGSARVKRLILLAEDARLMSDMKRVKKNYTDLMLVNRELIAEYNKRAANHEALLANLKEVNQVVQRASNLRVGRAKARVVAEARGAIKKSDAEALLQIISQGKAGQ